MSFTVKGSTLLGGLVTLVLLVTACGGGAAPTPAPTATSLPKPTATPVVAPTNTPVAVPTPTRVAATTVAATSTPAPTQAVAQTPTPQAATPKTGGTLRYVLFTAPPNFDIHTARALAAGVMLPLSNWLVQNTKPYYQGGGSGISPDLAERWEVSPEGKVYTFSLVKNAKWHDGKPVTAKDVVFTYNRIGSDQTLVAAPTRATFNVVDKMEAVDDYTVRITLKRVSASFLALLGDHENVIYPQHAVDQMLAFKPVGSGPFKLTAYQKDVKVTEERNTDYFKKDPQGRALPYLDRLEGYVIVDDSAKTAAFRAGQVDIMDPIIRITESKYQEIKSSMPDIVGTPLYNGWLFWGFRNKPPFDDVRVRKALSLAMDRQDWNKITNEGQGDPYILYQNSGGQWTVPREQVSTWPGYRQPKDADIAEAKRLLQEANFDFSKPINVEYGPTYPDQPIVAGDILRRNLGITTVFKRVDRGIFTQDQRAGNFDILYDGNSAGVDDPVSIFPTYYRSDGAGNYGKFSDAQLDQMIDRLESTMDPKGRLQLTQDIQKRIALDLVWTPTHGGWFRRYLWRSFIQGWVPQQGAQDGVPYRHETTWLSK